MNILSTVSFGTSYFEIAVALREAHLINGMLSSAEVLHGVRKKETEELEDIDKPLLRKKLDAPMSSGIESNPHPYSTKGQQDKLSPLSGKLGP